MFSRLWSDVESDWSPVHDAAFSGRVSTLQRLIAQVPSCLTARCSCLSLSFHLTLGDWRDLCALQGGCVNLNTLDRVSPLHGACGQGHAGCAKLLVENGANVSEKKDSGSKLHWLVTVSGGLKTRKTLVCQLQYATHSSIFSSLLRFSAGYSLVPVCSCMWKNNTMATPTGWHVDGLQSATVGHQNKAGVAASLGHFLSRWQRTKCSFISWGESVYCHFLKLWPDLIVINRRNFRLLFCRVFNHIHVTPEHSLFHWLMRLMWYWCKHRTKNDQNKDTWWRTNPV